jgi:hypothetical protein
MSEPEWPYYDPKDIPMDECLDAQHQLFKWGYAKINTEAIARVLAAAKNNAIKEVLAHRGLAK